MNLLNRIATDVRLMFRRPVRMQCAALCYRFKKKTAMPEMLVITSRDTGRWVIPKGWPMEGKSSHQAAAREAFEEAGVKGEVGGESIGTYTYQKRMDHGLKIECDVQVFPLVVFEMCKQYREKGVRTLDWVSFEEAASRVAEPELKALIESFHQRLLATVNTDHRTAAR